MQTTTYSVLRRTVKTTAKTPETKKVDVWDVVSVERSYVVLSCHRIVCIIIYFGLIFYFAIYNNPVQS